MAYIRMSELMDEFRNWGVSCGLSYDDDGDGWVISVSGRGREQIVVHHGFSYKGSVFADTDRLVVESDTKNLHGPDWIMVMARLGWFVENKSVPHLNDFLTADGDQLVAA